MLIQELVRSAREKHGWTQKEASIKCDMSLPAYNAVECGRHVPSLYNAIVMSETLGFALDQITLPKDAKKGTKRAAAEKTKKAAKPKKEKPAAKPKVKKHSEIAKAEKKVAAKKVAKAEKKAAKAKKPDPDAQEAPADDFNQDAPKHTGALANVFKNSKK